MAGAEPPATAPAELIVVGARIWTGDEARPDASALAVRGGVFARVGSDAEALALRGPETRVIDARGRRLVPGLNDSHLHATREARFFASELRWEGVPTLAEGLGRIRDAAARTPPGQWLRVVGGWSPHQFAERRLPTPAELDAAAPDTPVFVLYLYSRGILNRAGVRALGITAATQPPPGGRYELGPDGEPTGLLIADPSPVILYRTIDALPRLSPEAELASARRWYAELARLGLTSASDAGGGGHRFPDDYAASQALARRGELPLRLAYFLFPQQPGAELADFERWIAEHQPGENGDPRRVGGYALRGAGELLVASASDYENFLGERPEFGPKMAPELEAVVELLVRARWPFRIHATYDQSIGAMLDVLERVNARVPFAGLRFAIDHAETVSPGNVARVRALGGGFAIQDRMAFAGEEFAARYGAPAAAAAPPIREMLRQGVPVGAGSDGTRVSSYDPWAALHWLVTGETAGGAALRPPEERLSRAEALSLYTAGSAWISGEEGVKGRIREGQLADFALLSRDYFEVQPAGIRGIESVLTVVGGDVVHAAEGFQP